MLTKRESKWGLSDEVLERQERIERLHEAIAYHQNKIDEFECEIEALEGRAQTSEDIATEDSF